MFQWPSVHEGCVGLLTDDCDYARRSDDDRCTCLCTLLGAYTIGGGGRGLSRLTARALYHDGAAMKVDSANPMHVSTDTRLQQQPNRWPARPRSPALSGARVQVTNGSPKVSLGQDLLGEKYRDHTDDCRAMQALTMCGSLLATCSCHTVIIVCTYWYCRLPLSLRFMGIPLMASNRCMQSCALSWFMSCMVCAAIA